MTERPAAEASGSTGASVRNPWERFGWVIQSVWLVFLVFPVISIVSGGLPPWQVVVALALVLTFAVVYGTGAQHLQRLDRACEPTERRGVVYLLLLVGCTLGLTPLIGAGALGFLPFVVSFGMFALPLAWSIALGITCVAVATSVAVFVDPDEGTWVLAVIVFAVGAMTGAIRLMTDRGADYERMSRDLAIVEERERMARDVHDVLGQLCLDGDDGQRVAERLVDLDPERAKGELAEIQALSRQALAEIRATVGGLRVARLGDELASARTAFAGAGIEGHVPDDPSAVDPRHRTVLAWVLREATTNVVRHSDADTCWVELATNRLSVRDDGRGLGARPEGNGIRGLRERVEAAGGRLSLETGPQGHGTVLEVTL